MNAVRLSWGYAICLPLMLLVAEGVGQDTITLLRGARRSAKILGEITAVTPTEITVRSGGSERTVPVNEVQRINLASEPAELRRARTALLSGQFEQAAEALAGFELPANASTLLKQEVAFSHALVAAKLALLGNGDPEAAGRVMLDFVRQERNSYHFFEAVEWLGKLAQAAGNFDGAARYFQQLAKAPWPDYAVRSAVLIGAALQAQGKWDEAIAQYDQALEQNAAEPSMVRQQALARIGRATCVAEKGNVELAIQSVEDMIAKHDPADEELFAQAYLALGTCYRKSGQPLDAVLSYLHIDLLFYNQRDAHAEALYYLSLLWPELEEPARGVAARQTLQTRYPGSLWTKRSNG